MMSAPPLLRIVLGFLFLAHGLLAAAGVLGAFFLVVWAVKYLPAKKLKTLGLWLLGVGIVGCIVTVGASFGMMEWGEGHGMERGHGWMRNADDMMMKGWDSKDADGGYGDEGESSSMSSSSVTGMMRKK